MPLAPHADHPSPSDRVAIQKYKVFSLDYDGCLQDHSSRTPEDAKTTSSAQALFDKNRTLWDFLSLPASEQSQFTVIMNGSNRQTPNKEYLNAYGVFMRQKSPWWPAFIELSHQLNGKADPFILEDARSGNDDNPSVLETFSQYSEEEFKTHTPDVENAFDLGDDKKIVLLYAQMHRCASMYPQSDFTFVDDREDILGKLHSFYSQNTHLIPRGVTLSLTHYASYKSLRPAQFETPIEGTGTTNSQYQQVIRNLAVEESAERGQDEWEELLKAQHAKYKELVYQKAVLDLQKTLAEHRSSDSIIHQELATQGEKVLATIQENKPYVKDVTLPDLTDILNKTNKGIKNPLNTLDEYAQLTNKVIYRKPSIPKVIGGVMLGLLGVIGFAAGIALTASDFGAPIGIPLKIASAVAVKIGAIAVGAGLGMSVTGFASLFKRNNKTDIHKEVKAFHNQMQKANNPPRNACAFQAAQEQRNYEQNQTSEASLVTA